MIRKQLTPLKDVVRLVVVMITIIVAVYLSVTAAFAYLLKQSENESLKARVSMAFIADKRYSLKLIREYSYWDEAYKQIVKSKNQEWIKSNIDNYFFPEYGFDILNVVIDGKAYTVSTSDRVKALKDNYYEFNAMKDLQKLNVRGGAKTYFKKIGEQVYRVYVTSFMSEENDRYRDELFIVFQLIDRSHLDELSTYYDLPRLHFSNDSDSGNNRFNYLLADSAGESISKLQWELITPVKDLMPYFAFFGLMILLCSIFVSRKILKIELSGREVYEEKLYISATRDSLTEVYNKKFFTDHANNEYKLLNSERRQFCLVLLDIDYFKSINDKFGHQAGDFALKEFSSVCKSSLRGNDLIGRVGGEEFAIFLPDASVDVAMNVCERIRIELQSHPLTGFGMIEVPLNFSAGLASEADSVGDFDDLYALADICLYKAKQSGRGKTVRS